MTIRGLPRELADFTRRTDIELVEAVDEFVRWFAANPDEPRTAALLGEFSIPVHFLFRLL